MSKRLGSNILRKNRRTVASIFSSQLVNASKSFDPIMTKIGSSHPSSGITGGFLAITLKPASLRSPFQARNYFLRTRRSFSSAPVRCAPSGDGARDVRSARGYCSELIKYGACVLSLFQVLIAISCNFQFLSVMKTVSGLSNTATKAPSAS